MASSSESGRDAAVDAQTGTNTVPESDPGIRDIHSVAEDTEVFVEQVDNAVVRAVPNASGTRLLLGVDGGGWRACMSVSTDWSPNDRNDALTTMDRCVMSVLERWREQA